MLEILYKDETTTSLKDLDVDEFTFSKIRALTDINRSNLVWVIDYELKTVDRGEEEEYEWGRGGRLWLSNFEEIINNWIIGREADECVQLKIITQMR